MVEVSVIIVNYNTKFLTADCIDSIFHYTHGINFEIIIVDNNSSDGSYQYLQKRFKDVLIIALTTNVGFGRANNIAVDKATGELLLFLNSDTLLIENSIKKLATFYKHNYEILKIGALGCVLVDEALKFNGAGGRFPSCKREIYNQFLVFPLFKPFVKKRKEDYNLKGKYFEIDYVIGADLMVAKRLFIEKGGFAKDFFMYYEESDFQKRLVNIGKRNYILSSSKIIHLEDSSGKNIKNYSNRKRIIIHTSRNIYLKRNDAEYFKTYKAFDMIFLILNFFNYKYSFTDNLKYIKEILKTYRS